MEVITLDGRKMKTPAETHLYIETQLEIKDFYGRNLDALWDILTGIGHSTCINVIHYGAAQKYLGAYALKLERVFLEASSENKFLKVDILG